MTPDERDGNRRQSLGRPPDGVPDRRAPDVAASDLDSQVVLVHLIARAVGQMLPKPVSLDEVMPRVSEALRTAAIQNELTMARLRVVIAAAYAVLSLAVHLWPWTARLASYPLTDVAVAVPWAAASLALFLLLRRGWYAPWLRRAVPLVDGAMLALLFVLIRRNAGPRWEDVAPGALAIVMMLSAALAFSGSQRLTRSATRLTGLIAFGVVLLAVALTPLPAAPAAALLGALLIVGAAAQGATTVVHRVLVNELGHSEVTRLFSAEQQAIQARELLARQEIEAREQMLRIVSHDLRSPLHTIKMGTELLDPPSLGEMQRLGLGAMKRAADHMHRLIEDLLDVARVRAGTFAVEPRPTAAGALAAEAVESLAFHASHAGVTLEASAALNLPVVLADPERVHQVFSNLIGNAIKFTPPGGRIVVSAVAQDGSVWFSVADTGPGIPPEQLPHVFRDFWQGPKPDRRGLGLGLAIAKAIVEAHGGRIDVESTVGAGTRFFFSLRAVTPP